MFIFTVCQFRLPIRPDSDPENLSGSGSVIVILYVLVAFKVNFDLSVPQCNIWSVIGRSASMTYHVFLLLTFFITYLFSNTILLFIFRDLVIFDMLGALDHFDFANRRRKGRSREHSDIDHKFLFGPSASLLSDSSTGASFQPGPSTSATFHSGPSTSAAFQHGPSTSTTFQHGRSTSATILYGPSTSASSQPGPGTSTDIQLVPNTSATFQPVPSTSGTNEPGQSTSTVASSATVQPGSSPSSNASIQPVHKTISESVSNSQPVPVTSDVNDSANTANVRNVPNSAASTVTRNTTRVAANSRNVLRSGTSSSHTEVSLVNNRTSAARTRAAKKESAEEKRKKSGNL
jgi:hypothetical protein